MPQHRENIFVVLIGTVIAFFDFFRHIAIESFGNGLIALQEGRTSTGLWVHRAVGRTRGIRGHNVRDLEVAT